MEITRVVYPLTDPFVFQSFGGRLEGEFKSVESKEEVMPCICQ